MNMWMQLAVIGQNINSGRTSLGQRWPSYHKTTKQIKKGQCTKKKDYNWHITLVKDVAFSESHSTNSACSYYDKLQIAIDVIIITVILLFYIGIPKIHYIRDYLPYSLYVDFYWTY